MLRFIAADLRRHWIGVAAIVLIIAFATALGVVVTLQERALRLGSARAAEAFDLVIGAPGSETQLVLSSVFLQAAPLPLMPGSVFAKLAADPRVAWAAPIGFGDFLGEQPIVGTTQALIDGLGKIAEGRSFEKLGDAVVGARVDARIGERFHPMHGQAFGVATMHGGTTYTVVGRMGQTGTPWDRAVIVPIEAVWRVHGLEAHGHDDHDEAAHEAAEVAAAEGGGHPLPEPVAAPAAAGAHHDAVVDLDDPIDPTALSDPGAPGLPAILVKPKTIADAYRLRQEFRGEHTLAVFPAEVLTRLYGTLGDARAVLAGVAIGAQALVGAAILLVVVVHILQRGRQIGALRAFGAPRSVVFAIVWAEAFLIIGTGLILGFGIGWVAARFVSSALTATSGVAMPVMFTAPDIGRLAAFLLVGGFVAVVPAMLAYRQSPAAALRGS